MNLNKKNSSKVKYNNKNDQFQAAYTTMMQQQMTKNIPNEG